jgi:hypothetical protein
MAKRERDGGDDSMAPEPGGLDDIGAIVAFYERTGVMPLSSVGPPIDRPIIPSRRPERIGDFDFTTEAGEAPSAPPDTQEAENSEAQKIRRDFHDMLDKDLKRL